MEWSNLGPVLLMFGWVIGGNAAIGTYYNRKAAALLRDLAHRPVSHEALDVRIRMTGWAVFGARISWKRADLKVVGRVLYIFQFYRILGRRMGQPVLVVPFRGAATPPDLAVFTPRADPTTDDGALVVAYRKGMTRGTLRASVPDPESWVSALKSD